MWHQCCRWVSNGSSRLQMIAATWVIPSAVLDCMDMLLVCMTTHVVTLQAVCMGLLFCARTAQRAILSAVSVCLLLLWLPSCMSLGAPTICQSPLKTVQDSATVLHTLQEVASISAPGSILALNFITESRLKNLQEIRAARAAAAAQATEARDCKGSNGQQSGVSSRENSRCDSSIRGRVTSELKWGCPDDCKKVGSW